MLGVSRWNEREHRPSDNIIHMLLDMKDSTIATLVFFPTYPINSRCCRYAIFRNQGNWIPYLTLCWVVYKPFITKRLVTYSKSFIVMTPSILQNETFTERNTMTLERWIHTNHAREYIKQERHRGCWHTNSDGALAQIHQMDLYYLWRFSCSSTQSRDSQARENPFWSCVYHEISLHMK